VKVPAIPFFVLSFLVAVPSLNAEIIFGIPSFPPSFAFGSYPNEKYTVTSPGFANGWTMSDLWISDIRDVVLSGCQPLEPVCVETDVLSRGSFTLSALINGQPFLERGPMQIITVQHNRQFLGTELLEDVMTIDISWMRAYPSGAATLLIWLNPYGTMVAKNIGGGYFDVTLGLTARTRLRTETGVIQPFEEVLGPEIPLGVPEPSHWGVVSLVVAIAMKWKKRSSE
jgi:hypothetical protein